MKLISVVLLIGVSIVTQAAPPNATTVKSQRTAATTTYDPYSNPPSTVNPFTTTTTTTTTPKPQPTAAPTTTTAKPQPTKPPTTTVRTTPTTMTYPTTLTQASPSYPFLRKATTKKPTRTYYGMAQINYANSGHVCCGVLLKPWILLTAASCVKGRDSKRLRVRVTYRDGRGKRLSELKVHQVKMHPKYDPKNLENNFAIMSIYSKLDYGAEQFDLPKQNYKTEDIINQKFKTMGQLLVVYNKSPNVYLIRTNNRRVTTNFRVCNEVGGAPNYYCAERGSSKAKLSKSDIGAPLFYRPPKASALTKELLGIYTGRSVGQYVNGHVFESVFPATEFIETFITQHPVAPFY